MEFQPQHQSIEHTGLVSFNMGWLYLLAVQGTLKSLLQHHSSKASILNNRASHVALVVKNPSANVGDTREKGSILEIEDPLKESIPIRWQIN